MQILAPSDTQTGEKQATNKCSKSVLRKKKAGWDINEKERDGVGGLVYVGQSGKAFLIAQWHWSEETPSEAEGIGRS